MHPKTETVEFGTSYTIVTNQPARRGESNDNAHERNSEHRDTTVAG